MHQYFIFVVLWAVLPWSVSAQRYLQLERINSPRTKKFYPGSEITFQLSNGQWYHRVIEDVSYERQFIFFAYGHVASDSIIALRSYQPARWSQPLGNQFINFAVVWVLFALIDETVSEDSFQRIEPAAYLVPLSSAATGLSIKKLFRQRTFRLKKDKRGMARKWRLRIIDLEVGR